MERIGFDRIMEFFGGLVAPETDPRWFVYDESANASVTVEDLLERWDRWGDDLDVQDDSASFISEAERKDPRMCQCSEQWEELDRCSPDAERHVNDTLVGYKTSVALSCAEPISQHLAKCFIDKHDSDVFLDGDRFYDPWSRHYPYCLDSADHVDFTVDSPITEMAYPPYIKLERGPDHVLLGWDFLCGLRFSNTGAAAESLGLRFVLSEWFGRSVAYFHAELHSVQKRLMGFNSLRGWPVQIWFEDPKWAKVLSNYGSLIPWEESRQVSAHIQVCCFSKPKMTTTNLVSVWKLSWSHKSCLSGYGNTPALPGFSRIFCKGSKKDLTQDPVPGPISELAQKVHCDHGSVGGFDWLCRFCALADFGNYCCQGLSPHATLRGHYHSIIGLSLQYRSPVGRSVFRSEGPERHFTSHDRGLPAGLLKFCPDLLSRRLTSFHTLPGDVVCCWKLSMSRSTCTFTVVCPDETVQWRLESSSLVACSYMGWGVWDGYQVVNPVSWFYSGPENSALISGRYFPHGDINFNVSLELLGRLGLAASRPRHYQIVDNLRTAGVWVYATGFSSGFIRLRNLPGLDKDTLAIPIARSSEAGGPWAGAYDDRVGTDHVTATMDGLELTYRVGAYAISYVLAETGLDVIFAGLD